MDLDKYYKPKEEEDELAAKLAELRVEVVKRDIMRRFEVI